MSIKVLSDKTINRIAAGEVVERPLSVAKELVENSLDAGATNIEIEISRGGRNLVRICDNGCGIPKDELAVAIERHATSKLNEEDINNIQYMGFRGEALPSIASVSKMTISSKQKDADKAWELSIDGGTKSSVIPTSHPFGTTIEVRDLFCFTPARLKFLKSENSEAAAITDLVNRFALVFKNVSFTLISNDKKVLDYSSEDEHSSSRIGQVLGEEFAENSTEFSTEKAGMRIYGYAALPTYNRNTSSKQYYYVNNRIIRDKFFIGVTKAAYRNLLPNDRYPAIVLFLELPPHMVDVNVHPTKAEVRFRDENLIRGTLIQSIRSAIADSSFKTATNIATEAVEFIQKQSYAQSHPSKKEVQANLKLQENYNDSPLEVIAENFKTPTQQRTMHDASEPVVDYTFQSTKVSEVADGGIASYEAPVQEVSSEISEKMMQDESKEFSQNYPLGFAKCQIKSTYIISESEDGIVIVDQHAAHERLVLEKMKKQVERGSIARQALLVPQVVELGIPLTEKILEKSNVLKKLGIILERNGSSQIAVREIPALLKGICLEEFINAVAEEIDHFDDVSAVHERFDYILGNIACRSSVRAGRKLNIEGMNSLLREMEETQFSGQCNHGRPTYTKLSMKDLEKIFERI